MNFKNILWLKKVEETNSTQEKKVEDLFEVVKNDNTSKLEKKVTGSSDMSLWKYSSWEDKHRIVELVNDIFLNALKLRASDIHIEPREKKLKIRFRVDWFFVKYKDFKVNKKEGIIARIKILAYLRIDEHRQPQDWKINYKLFGWKSIDMRVSVIPTIYGEKCVIRLLKKDEKPPELKSLWIMPYNMVRIKSHLKDSYWMILAVWPTGSWKSTTLFAMLNQFNPEEKNISTLEDPVEYRIKWVNHTQIQPAIDFTFAKWLRSLLRQDPDIIMVWEIRDEETAKLAVEASITWHIVFSTLHTNSAVHTIQRLLNLWVDPLLITSSLKSIISQRLARKLCVHCKKKYNPWVKINKYIYWEIWKYIKNKKDLFLYKPSEWWCEKCNGIWYKGRIGFYEILEVTEWLEKLILQNASRTQLEIQAIWDWMVTIKEDALLKAVLWETSLEEILSVLGH